MPKKARNTSTLIDPSGEIGAAYRKIHMFDVDVGGVSYRESAHEDAGEPKAGLLHETIRLCLQLILGPRSDGRWWQRCHGYGCLKWAKGALPRLRR